MTTRTDLERGVGEVLIDEATLQARIAEMGEEISAAAAEVEHPLATQPDVAVELLHDPATDVRAEVPRASGTLLAEEVPRRRDLLGRPDDLV